MVRLQVDRNVVVIPTIGGTGTASLEYDGEGFPVFIYRRLAGAPWTRLNLIQETGAQTAEEAAEAEIRGTFPTPPMSPGEVLQYGLLQEESLDPNSQDFSLGRFTALVTVVAVLAGESEQGWIRDENTSVGGTYYRRQVTTGSRTTTALMEVGRDQPEEDAAGIWRIPNPARTLASTAGTDHVLEAVGLLPGHHHFATILLVDGDGRWSSLAEDFTTLQRKVTVTFDHLEVVNDSDPASTGEGVVTMLVRQGGRNVREFTFDHGNLSDKVNERHITLQPFGFVHVIGPEVVVPENEKVGVWVLGTEFDGLFDTDEHAASRMIDFALPTGFGQEQVLGAPVLAHCRPSSDGSDFELKVTVLHSIEYVP